MTDEEAAAIQARWVWISRDLLPDKSQAKADIRALLDERAALAEIARALVGPGGPICSDEERGWFCVFCESTEYLRNTRYLDVRHTADCPVTKARAWMTACQESQP